ncbi:MAG: hypothetical protein BWX70_01509 [Verrucomicrobia bacterium ADurb.Bin070]|nr:MAG: hypothetical protein BWX70_01509 [Verrucomicrobia bacterium ADurb.Bin070]
MEVDGCIGAGYRIRTVGGPGGRIRDHAFGGVDVRDGAGHPVEAHGVGTDGAAKAQRAGRLLPRGVAGGVRHAVAHGRRGINQRAHARRAAVRNILHLRRIGGQVGVVQRHAVGAGQGEELAVFREAEGCVPLAVGEGDGRAVREHHEVPVGRQQRAVRDAPFGRVRRAVAQEPAAKIDRAGTAVVQLDPVAGRAGGRQQPAVVVGDKLADRDRRARWHKRQQRQSQQTDAPHVFVGLCHVSLSMPHAGAE